MTRMRLIRLKFVFLLISTIAVIIFFIRSSPRPSFVNKVVEATVDADRLYPMNNSETLNAFKLRANELETDLDELLEQRNKVMSYRLKNERLDLAGDLKTMRAMTDDELAHFHPAEPHTYLILEYTKVFFQPKFCSKSVDAIFNSAIEKCPFNNCAYSCAKEADLARADLLIFHLRDLEAEYEQRFRPKFDDWVRSTKQLPFKTPDEKRKNNDKQLWLLWNDESTPIDPNFNKLSSLFNWTMSFKTNSEVFEGSYGFLSPRADLSYGVVSKLKKSLFYDDFIGRRNAILWFVSNCKSKHRIRVALEISKYYPVFIYGKCNVVDDLTSQQAKSLYPYLNSMGENERSMEDFARLDCKEDTNCDERKYRTFKYYLAFENRNCTDYITEKVWRTLDKGIVPIVLQPSRESYIRYEIPSESYIHLEDFDHDAKKLTEHLKRVDRDFSQYYNYRKWTSVYNRIEWRADYLEPHRMCQLCKLLNTFNRTISYNSIGNFFNNRCHDK